MRFTSLAALSAALILGLGANAAQAAAVEALDGSLKPVKLEVKDNPQRLVVIDYASLDLIDGLGLGERVVGSAKGAAPDYLDAYLENDSIVNVGTVKEVSLERIMSLEPDLIMIGPRLAASYDDLSAIAPTLMLAADPRIGLVPSLEKNFKTLETIFGLKDDASRSKIDALKARLEKVRKKAEGKTAVVGLVSASAFNILGNGGRCALVGTAAGFVNLAPEVKTTHGNETSFELLVRLNPDYIFVLDRDSAIGTEGAQLASDLLDNELMHKTQAYQNGRIIYLNPAAWYLAEGGLTALEIMISDLEKAVGIKDD